MPWGVGQEHRYLGVLDASCSAGVVALHVDTVDALLEVPGVVEDQHRGDRPTHRSVAAHIVADQIGVPYRLTQQPLHAVWRSVSACSANCQHERVSTSDTRPSRNARARRLGSTRRNRPATRARPESNSSKHPSASTLSIQPGRHAGRPVSRRG